LFFDFCPSQRIIGITGTKGKGTTASLIHHILKIANKQSWLGGNIGVAPFDFLEEIKKTDWLVLELSSFQLEDIMASPHIGLITNFSKEHLAPADPLNPNYHKSLQQYWLAKFSLAKWQSDNDYLIVNEKLAQRIKKYSLPGKLIFFRKSDLPSQLVGEHNQENIGAAAAVAKIIKIKPGTIKRAVASFPGLEHRLEPVKEIKGIKCFNDTFATTPEAAITALKAFSFKSAKDLQIILIAGGADKGSDFKNLAREIKKQIKLLVLLSGPGTERLKKQLKAANYPQERIKEFKNMNSAVKQAWQAAEPGNVILLAPGCASFGLFKNYKQRGQLFKEAVRQLK